MGDPACVDGSSGGGERASDAGEQLVPVRPEPALHYGFDTIWHTVTQSVYEGLPLMPTSFGLHAQAHDTRS